MKVKDLIRHLKKMPQNAEVLVYIKELGSYQNVDLIKTEDGKSFVRDYGDIVVVLKEKPFEREQPKEELVNFCPDCTVYCEQRFIDGICK